MWTPANRGRMIDIAKKTKRYPSDLTDEEWERIAPFLPRPAKKDRKPGVDLREVLNAIRYMARSGGGWRMLPSVTVLSEPFGRHHCDLLWDRNLFRPRFPPTLFEGRGMGNEPDRYS